MKKMIATVAGVGVVGVGALLGMGVGTANADASAPPQPCQMYIGNGQFAPCPPPATDDGSDGSAPLSSPGSSLPDGQTATATLDASAGL